MKTVRLTDEQIDRIEELAGNAEADEILGALANATDTPGPCFTEVELNMIYDGVDTLDPDNEQARELRHNLLAKLEAHGPGGSQESKDDERPDILLDLTGGVLQHVVVSRRVADRLGLTEQPIGPGRIIAGLHFQCVDTHAQTEMDEAAWRQTADEIKQDVTADYREIIEAAEKAKREV